MCLLGNNSLFLKIVKIRRRGRKERKEFFKIIFYIWLNDKKSIVGIVSKRRMIYLITCNLLVPHRIPVRRSCQRLASLLIDQWRSKRLFNAASAIKMCIGNLMKHHILFICKKIRKSIFSLNIRRGDRAVKVLDC